MMEYCAICGNEFYMENPKVMFFSNAVCHTCYVRYLVNRNNLDVSKEEAISLKKDIDALIERGTSDEKVIPPLKAYQKDLEILLSDYDNKILEIRRRKAEEKALDDLMHNKLNLPKEATPLVPIIFGYIDWMAEKEKDVKENLEALRKVALLRLKERMISFTGSCNYKEQVQWLADNSLISSSYLEELHRRIIEEEKRKEEQKRQEELRKLEEERLAQEKLEEERKKQQFFSDLENKMFGTSNSTSTESSTLYNVASSSQEQVSNPYRDTPDAVHWDTIIDGRGFKYAWFVSYIGLPASAVVSFFNMIMYFSITPVLGFLGLIDFALAVIVASGLYRFKSYALSTLKVLWIFVGIDNLVSLLTGNILGAIIGFSVLVSIVVYFSNRKEAYTK